VGNDAAPAPERRGVILSQL